MMKKFTVFVIALFIAGCANEGKNLQTYLENPTYLIKDPHFEAYRDKREQLEAQYLRKEITYSEYIQQRQMLDDQYDQEVRERRDIVNPQR